jgi:UDP-MurNAc hydroxylase
VFPLNAVLKLEEYRCGNPLYPARLSRRKVIMPVLDFMGHASYAVSSGSARLLVDPWFKGHVFDSGWNQISQPAADPAFLEQVTCIWISHEHPDHFSPPSLLSLPDRTRREALVLFQETKDKRVVGYLQKNGFRTKELASGETFTPAQDFSIRTFSRNDGDSWMLLDTQGVRIINLNDCVLDTPGRLKLVKRVVGKADVLLTQFGYANWKGNRDEPGVRVAAVAQKLKTIQLQARALQAKAVIPFASFVYFCHEENRFMNDSLPSLRDVIRAIEEVNAQPVLLYPGDSWSVGTPWDNDAALNRYAVDYATIAQRELVKSRPASLSEIKDCASKLLEDVASHNSRSFLKLLYGFGALTPLRCWISDLAAGCELSLLDGLSVPSRLKREECDIELESGAFAYALKFPWGMGTLLVNARFQTISPHAERRYSNVCEIRSLNMRGFSLPRDLPRVMAERLNDEGGPAEFLRRVKHRLASHGRRDTVSAQPK